MRYSTHEHEEEGKEQVFVITLVDQRLIQEGSDDPKRKKEMDGVAKHMRFKITTKKAIIKGENVEYFTGDLCMHQGNSYHHFELCVVTGTFLIVYKCLTTIVRVVAKPVHLGSAIR